MTTIPDPMTEQEVLQAIRDGDTAYDLLIEANPAFDRRFRRLCRSLIKLMADVKEHFPDAQYYTGGEGGLGLLLGDPHNQNTNELRPQQQVQALYFHNIDIGDGGW